MPALRPVTAIVADDDHRFRRLVKGAAGRIGLAVVGEADDGDAAIDLIRSTKPAVAVLDMWMPGIGGMEVLRRVRSSGLSTRLVLISAFERLEWVTDAMEAGAYAVISKEDPWRHYLAVAVRRPEGGGVVMSEGPLRLLINDYCRLRAATSTAGSLTTREVQIAKFVAEGLGNKEIADQLLVTVRTVENIRYRMMRKIGAHGVVDVVRYVDSHLRLSPSDEPMHGRAVGRSIL